MQSSTLADTCAELLGPIGAVGVLMNRLLRMYQDAPTELQQLKAQITSTRGILEELLPILDSDSPGLQHPTDIAALDIHLGEIASLIQDIKDHGQRLTNSTQAQAASAKPFAEIWTSDEISYSETSLAKQADALNLYINTASAPEASTSQTSPTPEAQQASPVPSPQISEKSPPPPPPHAPAPAIEEPEENSEPAPPAYSTSDDTHGHYQGRPHSKSVSNLLPTAQQSPTSPAAILAREQAHLNRPHSQSVSSFASSSMTPGNIPRRLPVDRPVSSMSPSTENSQPSVPPPHVNSQPSTPSTETRSIASFQAYQGFPMGVASRPNQRKMLSAWTAMNVPSARRVKSMMLDAIPGQTESKPTSPVAVAQDPGFDEQECRRRTTSYSRRVTTSWQLLTILDKQRTKQQVYRHRFTGDPDDDISPGKLPTNFKVAEHRLYDAILHQDLATVQDVMEHTWSNNVVVEKQDQATALHVAASLGLCSIVQSLLATGAKADRPDRYGVTALHHAADFGCANCIQMLVSSGAGVDIDAPKSGVKTPLYYAAGQGNIAAVRTLLQLGARVFYPISSQKETMMFKAVKSGKIEICEALLAAGADPNESFSLLLLAASKSPALLACLCKGGARVDRVDSNHETLLHKYISFGDTDMVECLLSLGADPNNKDPMGNFPLHLAIVEGSYPASLTLVKMLLASKANPNSRGFLSISPLLLAVEEGRADVAHVLCQAGANLTELDGRGTNPWIETQKADYTGRRGRNNNKLANFQATKDVLQHWFATKSSGAAPGLPSNWNKGLVAPVPAPNAGTQELSAKPIQRSIPELASKPLSPVAQELDSIPTSHIVHELDSQPITAPGVPQA